VAAGAIAKLLLKELNIEVKSGICAIENITIPNKDFDFDNSCNSEVYSLNKNYDDKFKDAINNAREEHDSIGGIVALKATNIPIGLGEPIYYKLDAILANAMMSINASKAVEIGNAIESVRLKGSVNNDQITKEGFTSNNSGGILGGISNGDDINMKVYFKPTPSIFKTQDTIDINNKELKCELKGRHDPCVATRGSVVAESMMALVLADMVLLNMSSKIDNVKRVYQQ